MWTNVSQVHVDHESSASTSLDRSAVIFVLMMMTMMRDVVVWLVSQTLVRTVPHVSLARTADIRACVGPGLRVSGVRSRPVGHHDRRLPAPVSRNSVSTEDVAKWRPTALRDVYVDDRGLDDIARFVCSLQFKILFFTKMVKIENSEGGTVSITQVAINIIQMCSKLDTALFVVC